MKIIFLVTSIIILLSAQPASASILWFSPSEVPFRQAVDFGVSLVVDTEGKNINAIEGKLVLDREAPQVKEIRSAGSIVSFWIQKPKQEDNKIFFSGTIPGGFIGAEGLVLTIIFEPSKALKDVPKMVELTDVKVLLNDGLGTTDTAKLNSVAMKDGVVLPSFNPNFSEQQNSNLKDNTPPEIFSPQVSRSSDLFNNQWFIVFDTQDKQSGVSHYEIQETKNGKIKEGAWLKVSSPYLLTDQQLNSFIYVIAVDNQGNERVIKVFPRNPLSWWAMHRDELIIALVLILAVLLTYFTTRLSTKRHEKNPSN